MQIAQFVIDIGILCVARESSSRRIRKLNGLAKSLLDSVYSKVAVNYIHFLPNKGDCSGSFNGGLFGGILIVSYLGLFIDFYNQTFKASAAKIKE
jgi:hypothetical protein